MSRVSLAFIILFHVFLASGPDISFSGLPSSSITQRHLSAHISHADSDITRVANRFSPWDAFCLIGRPHDRISPSEGLEGHLMLFFSRRSLANFQICSCPVAGHSVRMCSGVSVQLHFGHKALSGMFFHSFPTGSALCMSFHRNTFIFLGIMNFDLIDFHISASFGVCPSRAFAACPVTFRCSTVSRLGLTFFAFSSSKIR